MRVLRTGPGSGRFTLRGTATLLSAIAPLAVAAGSAWGIQVSSARSAVVRSPAVRPDMVRSPAVRRDMVRHAAVRLETVRRMRVLMRVATARAAAASASASADVRSAGDCFSAGLVWVCVHRGDVPGRLGRPGMARDLCTFTKAPAGILDRTGTGPPSPGEQWDIMHCPGPRQGPVDGELVQVSIATGQPAISPRQLLQIALRRLRVPALEPSTAPPRGRAGLVGLPEWFWIPRRRWRPMAITVRAGPIWAIAVATPRTLTFQPGAGLAAVSCPGPGTPYRTGQPAGTQRTRCSYTYPVPSAGQPGQAYQADVIVGWRIAWTGSSGAGGVVTSDYGVASALPIQVGQAEALVTGP